jgi:hypothetical protein
MVHARRLASRPIPRRAPSVTRSGEKLYRNEQREPTFGRRTLYGAIITLVALAMAIMVVGFFL